MTRRLAPPLALLLALLALLPGPAAADGRWRLDATGRVEVELLSDAGASEVRVALRDRTSLLMVDDATVALLEALGLRTGYSQVASWSGGDGPSLSCPSIGVDLLCHADAAGGWVLVPEPGRAVLVARGAEAPGRRTIRVVPDTASLAYDVALIAVGLALEVLVGGPVSVVAERAISLALELAPEAIGAADALLHGDTTAAARELASLAMRAWSVIVEHAPMWAAALGLSLAIDMVPPLAAIRLSIAAGKAVVALVVLAVALLDTLDGEGSEVTLAWSGGPVAEASEGPGDERFTPTGPMTDGSVEAAVLLADGRVAVLHDHSVPSGDTMAYDTVSVDVYDPDMSAFTARGGLLVPRGGAAEAPLADGRLLVAGGSRVWFPVDALSDAEIYDPTTGVAERVADLTVPRALAASALLPDGRVLIAGGTSGELLEGTCCETLPSAELYDPNTGLFSPTGSMLEPRERDAAFVLPDGRVLLVGGQVWTPQGGNRLTSTEIYDPATETFEIGPSLPVHRDAPAITQLDDGRVLVAGGGRYVVSGEDTGSGTPVTEEPTGTAWLWDLRADQFEQVGALRNGRWGAAAAPLPAGGAIVVGGIDHDGDGPALDTAEVFDPESGDFTVAGRMGSARTDPFAVALHDGAVLVAGGWPGYPGQYLTSSELFR